MNKRQRTLALNTVSATVEEITPALAQEWMKVNINNRRTHHRGILSYIAEMSKGNWECNGESIIFDSKGKLRDGQNRLMAIIKSNTTIVCVVVKGVKPSAFDTMNQGIIRTVAQIFDLNKNIKVNGGKLGAVLKTLHTYYEYNNVSGKMNLRFSPRLAEELRLEYKGCEDSVTFATNFKRPLLSPMMLSSLHYIFASIDKNSAEIFLTALLTGDCGDYKEILKLRNYFLDIKMNEKTKALMGNRTFVGGVIIKAWNAFRKNEKMHDFEYKKGEEFPRAK